VCGSPFVNNPALVLLVLLLVEARLCSNGAGRPRQWRIGRRKACSAFSGELSQSPRFLPAAFPLPPGHPLLADLFDTILALALLMNR
jgi:hypothetical protein